MAEVVEDPDGVLISRSGSDIGAEYVVGTRPVSIGSGELCAVRVPDRGLSSVEARIWVRTGRLMVHRLTSLNALANDGTVGGWQILEPGDILELGPHKFEFRLLPSPQPLEARDDVPNILRDPKDGGQSTVAHRSRTGDRGAVSSAAHGADAKERRAGAAGAGGTRRSYDWASRAPFDEGLAPICLRI